MARRLLGPFFVSRQAFGAKTKVRQLDAHIDGDSSNYEQDTYVVKISHLRPSKASRILCSGSRPTETIAGRKGLDPPSRRSLRTHHRGNRAGDCGWSRTSAGGVHHAGPSSDNVARAATRHSAVSARTKSIVIRQHSRPVKFQELRSSRSRMRKLGRFMSFARTRDTEKPLRSRALLPSLIIDMHQFCGLWTSHSFRTIARYCERQTIAGTRSLHCPTKGRAHPRAAQRKQTSLDDHQNNARSDGGADR